MVADFHRLGRCLRVAVEGPAPLAAAPVPAAASAAPEAWSDAVGAAVGFLEVDVEIVEAGGPLANVDARVEFGKILPRHPEGAVVVVFGLEDFLGRGVLLPLLGRVAPRPRPLVLAPGVSQLDEVDAPTRGLLVFEAPRVEDRVGVAHDEAVVEILLAVVGDGRTYQGLHAAVAPEEEEGVLGGILLVRPDEGHLANLLVELHVLALPLAAFLCQGKDGVARDSIEGPEHVPTLERGVGAAELGEGLLKHEDPELAAVGVCKERAPRGLDDGDVLVHAHRHPLPSAPVEERYLVLAPRIRALGHKGLLDDGRVLCHACKCSDEPAVPELALGHVLRMDASLKKLHPHAPLLLIVSKLLGEVFGGTPPLQLRLQLRGALPVPLTDGLDCGRKLFVLVLPA
mmetsp:Transcript_29289/g.85883  ORF Transcript_29289/g.85883 Transcript_29289/m.85883 type:complete len:399 (+) Transcript_29289:433-1629(+)